jgi:hypothetical protein
MIKELFNSAKIASLIKNKYGMFVLQKASSNLKPDEKLEIKNHINQKINLTSKQEKVKLVFLLELLN